jgi:hypothetical protein
MKKLFYFKQPETILMCHEKAPSSLRRDNYVEIDFKIPDDWSLHKIFDFFNQDSNPLGSSEGQEWIRKVGLHHTSMCVGDVVEQSARMMRRNCWSALMKPIFMCLI